jgi:hypothetical protein
MSHHTEPLAKTAGYRHESLFGCIFDCIQDVSQLYFHKYTHQLLISVMCNNLLVGPMPQLLGLAKGVSPPADSTWMR